jgi:hypothetical protein
VRLCECLVSFLGETTSQELMPEGTPRPRRADFRAWIELLANAAKNAVRMDAEIGLKAVEHLLGMFTAARVRLGR